MAIFASHVYCLAIETTPDIVERYVELSEWSKLTSLSIRGLWLVSSKAPASTNVPINFD
jgi:hypothetical protein